MGRSPGGVWVPGGPCWNRCSSSNPRRLYPGRRCGSGFPGLSPGWSGCVGGDGRRNGEPDPWERRLKVAGRLKSQEVPGGFRVALRLPLPAGMKLGYYDLTPKVQSGGREESGRTRLIVRRPRRLRAGLAGGGPPGLGFEPAALCLEEPGQLGRGGFCRSDDGYSLGRTPRGGVCGGQSPPCGRGASHSRPQSLFPQQPDFSQCFVPEPGDGAGDGGLQEGPGFRGQPGISGRQSPPGRSFPGVLPGSLPFKASRPESPV